MQSRVLKNLISKVENKVQLQERVKYQREYEIKSHVMHQWSHRVKDNHKLVNNYKAINHYK